MRYKNISDYENEVDYSGNIICRNCKNPVPKGRRHYCSEQCMHDFNENHSWFLIRKVILHRDRFRCQICKERKKKALLDIDHIIPVRMGIDPFDKNNLRTICKVCHKAKTRLDEEALRETKLI
jgi:5-methylcytosine-specific restriction enzyme A